MQDSNDQILKNYVGSWRIRRKVVIITLLFCASCILYIMINGSDTVLNQTLVYGLIGLASVVITGYCGFAVVDDNSIRKYNPRPGRMNVDNPDEYDSYDRYEEPRSESRYYG